jgi:2-dehydro-3-deoxygluconokinase
MHVTGITSALGEGPRQAVRAAILAARAVSFDLNYRSALWSRSEAADEYRWILPQTDVVFARDDEARIIFPEVRRPEDLAEALIDLGAGHAVVKRGADGALAKENGIVHSQPAVPVVPLNTVGAGDSFVAAYLAQWLSGCDMSDRLSFAATVAAMTCETVGDWEGAARRVDLVRGNDPVDR